MPGLFDPITIKGLTLKNRLVMPPMATGMATEDGEVTDRHIKHYTTRAKGGVGLIIIEHTYVAEDGKMSRGQLGLYNDRLVPGLKRLVDTIHAEGTKVIIQLTHGGAKAPRTVTGKQPAGPSNILLPNGVDAPRPLTIAEIRAIALQFGDAAYRAMEAGCDSVEVHGAHGFLLCQFLSPYSNKRNDDYGGSSVKRILFPAEVVKEIKSRIGATMPLFYRLGADDLLDGGLTREEGKLAAQHLARVGVDVMDVSAGIGVDAQRGLTEQGYFVPLAQGIKEVVKVPVIGVGNITEPEYADRIIREGKVDLVAIGRTLLSNPDFPRQAAEKLGIQL